MMLVIKFQRLQRDSGSCMPSQRLRWLDKLMIVLLWARFGVETADYCYPAYHEDLDAGINWTGLPLGGQLKLVMA